MQRSYPVVTLLVLAACSGANGSTDLFAGDGGTSSGSGKGGLGGLLNPGPTASDAGTDAATPAPATTSTATQPPAQANQCQLTTLKLSLANKCDACLDAHCCPEVQACDTQDCLQLLDCASACNQNTTCIQGCLQAHPASVNPVRAANQCENQSCANECAQ